jgi:hypothetical protein
MKPFQSSGLFGPRDVHRKILDIPLPEYDPANTDHQALAALGAKAAAKAAQWVRDAGVRNLSGRDLGRVRSQLRQHLAGELAAIDHVLARILGIELPSGTPPAEG